MGCARLLLVLSLAGCISIPAYSGGDGGTGSGDGGSEPITANVIFVTSQSRAPSSFGGDLTVADAWCQELADASSPKLPTNHYIAWLSKTGAPIDERIRGTSAKGWVRPDGKPVAATVDALLTGDHWYPPRFDESGRDLYDTDPLLATGTTAQGAPYNTCGDWADSGMLLQRGAPDASSYLWTEISSGSCTASRIYCLGIDKNVTVTLDKPAAGTTRVAFVSSAVVSPSGTRNALDMTCRTEAMNVGLGTNFVAAVATLSTSVASRFTLDKPWARVDGVVVLTADMTKMTAPIALDANGTRRVTDVLGGSESFLTPGPSTCNNWEDSAVTFSQGEAMRSVPRAALSTRVIDCTDTTSRVYCLQQ